MNRNTSTLLDNIEIVVSAAKMYRLNDMFYAVAQGALDELSARLGITTKQALVFALLLEFGHKRRIYMSAVVDMIGCDSVRTMAFMNEADVLCERGLVVRVRVKDETYYIVPVDVIDAVKENRLYEPEPIANLNEARFFSVMDKIFRRAHSHEQALHQSLVDLINANKHIPFVQGLIKYGIMDNCENTWDVLMACVYANRLITYDDDIVGRHDWECYFRESINTRTIEFGLLNGTLKLCRCNLIEMAKYKGIWENYHYHFTNRAKRELFPNHPFLVVNKNRPNKRRRFNQVDEEL